MGSRQMWFAARGWLSRRTLSDVARLCASICEFSPTNNSACRRSLGIIANSEAVSEKIGSRPLWPSLPCRVQPHVGKIIGRLLKLHESIHGKYFCMTDSKATPRFAPWKILAGRTQGALQPVPTPNLST